MSKNGLVSVIIPTFNRPFYLPFAIESVLSQSYPKIEIIVVDDGSEDCGKRTVEALEPYRDFISYVYQENQGIGAAVNKGLSKASGEYIQRLDDDDLLGEEKIEKSVEEFKKNPSVGLVATGYHVIDEEGNIIRTQMARTYKRARFLFMLMACISAQSAVMVRSECHDVVGKYRTDIMAEDYEMWLRIAKRYEIATVDEPLCFYRRHKDNITNFINKKRMERDTLSFVKSYLDETPLHELIPNLKSKPHGYALKAAVYLLKDGIHVRTFEMAKKELDKALTLAENAVLYTELRVPLLLLWEMVLAFHREDFKRLKKVKDDKLSMRLLLGEQKELAKEIMNLKEELKRILQSSLPPTSPEMTDFRRRFGKIRNELIRETLRRAVSG